MFYVISEELPTIAIFNSVSRAHAFKNVLVLELGYQASVLKVEEGFNV